MAVSVLVGVFERVGVSVVVFVDVAGGIDEGVVASDTAVIQRSILICTQDLLPKTDLVSCQSLVTDRFICYMTQII